jgi:hypothetical protein
VPQVEGVRVWVYLFGKASPLSKVYAPSVDAMTTELWVEAERKARQVSEIAGCACVVSMGDGWVHSVYVAGALAVRAESIPGWVLELLDKLQAAGVCTS